MTNILVLWRLGWSSGVTSFLRVSRLQLCRTDNGSQCEIFVLLGGRLVMCLLMLTAGVSQLSCAQFINWFQLTVQLGLAPSSQRTEKDNFSILLYKASAALDFG